MSLCSLAVCLLLWAGAAWPQGVDFAWRQADLQRHQRALSAPRTLYTGALAALEQARQARDVRGQLSALLDASAASAWLPLAQAQGVMEQVPAIIAQLNEADAEQRSLGADLLAFQGLNLVAARRLDDAAATLARAESLARTLQDPGHRATLELAKGLLALLRDDAPGALDILGRAYEAAVQDLTRAQVMTWQAAISRRASYFQYDQLRTALRLARESDRLASPEAYPALGTMNLSVLAQSEAVLGEPDEAERHGRLFGRLMGELLAQQQLDYGDMGMPRLLAAFRQQDIVLAESLARRRVLLTWGLLAAGLLAAMALTALAMQARQRRRLAGLSRELAARNEQLQHVARSHTRLLAASCHDLREPAHALCILAEMAESACRPDAPGPQAQSIDRHLASIRHCSMTLTDMLSELLDLTRIEGGHYVPERRPVALQDVLDDLRLHFQDTARRKGLTLEVAATDQHVRTDPYLLRRMLFSLVTNALRTTEAGEVRVSAVLDRHGTVQLRVQDSNLDMTPEVLSALLDRGPQAGGEGMGGVGVSIVKRAADLLEIPLTVTSQSGRGNLVTLSLEPAAPVLQARAPAMAAREGTAPLVIAVLEDDAESRQGMASLLRHWGYRVVTGTSAQDLKAAMAPSDAPTLDLLVTDLHLGALDGLEEAAQVRRWPGHERLPVILLTGDQDAALTLRAAADGVLVGYKPMLPRQLHATVQAALARPSPQGATTPKAA